MTSDEIKKELDIIKGGYKLEDHLPLLQWKTLALDLAILISKILDGMDKEAVE